LTPNLKEFEAAIGRRVDGDLEATLREESVRLLEQAGAEILVVTLGERGMGIFPRGEEAIFMPSSVLDVFDVSGAGDTVVAVLALGLAADLELADAVAVANEAAGVAVGKSGVAVVSPGELAGRFRPRVADKVLTRVELQERVAWWRVQGRRIVFTNGCFDLLHAGHISLLREAAHQGDVLIVAINSDASVQRLKGRDRPIITADERAAILAALACVDAVVTFDEDTPLEVLEEVRPDVLAKGADYTRDQVVGRELVESQGGEVHLIRLVPERSTSGLMRRIRGLDRGGDEDGG
jgi:D-beta-D-heptose 7-phosphate kinase/D-beta-D-heptose 1-phosphate adenosyltransferase